MSGKTELVVIGGGPGGHAAAFLAADRGMQVTLIDKEVNPGGVCLYRGCIPSKALLHVAKLINETRQAYKWGVKFQEPEIDIDKLRSFQDSVISKLTGGLGMLVKQRKINYIQGRAEFLSGTKLKIETEEGVKELEFENAILATGSVPVHIPAFDIGSPNIIDSTGALELKDIPKSMLVVGGGYIGLELSSVYAALGTDITVVEMLPQILTGPDKDLANILARKLQSTFKSIMTGTKVVSVEDTGNGIRVKFEGPNVTEPEQVFDKVLVSIGRTPVSKGLGLENTKAELTERGFVKVDGQRRTAEPTIFAIGDIAGNPMLAHKASAEGKVAVEAILGHKDVFAPAAIPAVIFTDPEIAWAGITEAEARERKLEVKVARFPWAASGRATTIDRNEGLTKLIVDAKTERILGVAIAGPGAGEMIAEGVLAIEMAAVAKDIALTIHPHPTLSETVMEAAEVLFGESTNLYRPKR